LFVARTGEMMAKLLDSLPGWLSVALSDRC
jgi:hypothetical protein